MSPAMPADIPTTPVEPKPAPYRVEVESERQETVRMHGVVGPDGYMQGQFFEDADDAEELADALNSGWLAGVASEHERCVERLVRWMNATYPDCPDSPRDILRDR